MRPASAGGCVFWTGGAYTRSWRNHEIREVGLPRALLDRNRILETELALTYPGETQPAGKLSEPSLGLCPEGKEGNRGSRGRRQLFRGVCRHPRGEVGHLMLSEVDQHALDLPSAMVARQERGAQLHRSFATTCRPPSVCASISERPRGVDGNARRRGSRQLHGFQEVNAQSLPAVSFPDLSGEPKL